MENWKYDILKAPPWYACIVIWQKNEFKCLHLYKNEYGLRTFEVTVNI